MKQFAPRFGGPNRKAGMMNKSNAGSIRKATHKSLGRGGRHARMIELTLKSNPVRAPAAASRRQEVK